LEEVATVEQVAFDTGRSGGGTIRFSVADQKT
jgi:hypothetical protein